MPVEYDVFEQYLDEFPLWRGSASGAADAKAMLQKVAAQTRNECFAVDLLTGVVLARVNRCRRARLGRPGAPGNRARK